ncbi:unnamed protein product [Orchesella dallaii]|uniref:Transmembrane protein n=1 Tax=Orchesella dallaii TaxID=48710 RepID=A0ABP1RLE7_9HEXA
MKAPCPLKFYTETEQELPNKNIVINNTSSNSNIIATTMINFNVLPASAHSQVVESESKSKSKTRDKIIFLSGAHFDLIKEKSTEEKRSSNEFLQLHNFDNSFQFRLCNKCSHSNQFFSNIINTIFPSFYSSLQQLFFCTWMFNSVILLLVATFLVNYSPSSFLLFLKKKNIMPSRQNNSSSHYENTHGGRRRAEKFPGGNFIRLSIAMWMISGKGGDEGGTRLRKKRGGISIQFFFCWKDKIS